MQSNNLNIAVPQYIYINNIDCVCTGCRNTRYAVKSNNTYQCQMTYSENRIFVIFRSQYNTAR